MVREYRVHCNTEDFILMWIVVFVREYEAECNKEAFSLMKTKEGKL